MKNLVALAAVSLAGLLIASATFAHEPGTTRGNGMASNPREQVVMRLFNEVFNGRSPAILDQLYDPQVVDHSAFPDQPPGIDGIESAIEGLFELFGDLDVTVQDVVADGDTVVTREVWSGTHKPTGRTAQGTVIHIFRVRNGKIVEEWSRGWDWLEGIPPRAQAECRS